MVKEPYRVRKVDWNMFVNETKCTLVIMRVLNSVYKGVFKYGHFRK